MLSEERKKEIAVNLLDRRQLDEFERKCEREDTVKTLRDLSCKFGGMKLELPDLPPQRWAESSNPEISVCFQECKLDEVLHYIADRLEE